MLCSPPLLAQVAPAQAAPAPCAVLAALLLLLYHEGEPPAVLMPYLP